jgi:ABC-2 type transport system ATP-binding protein
VPVIEVRELTKRFGQVTAVEDLSFGVDAGKVTGFLGPNGAGKTTTLRVLLGLVRPTAGAATIHGRPYRLLERPALQVGAVLESSGFYPGRHGRDHLRVLAAAAGLPERRVDEVLYHVGLAEAATRRVGDYSLGMRQRLALACALLGDPGVLILDEPANGLDPEGIHWLRGFLRLLAEQGRTVLVSSHVLAEVAQTVDEVVIIAGGRLVAQSTLAELTARTSPLVRVRSPDAERLRERLLAAERKVDLEPPDRLLVHDATTEEVGRAAHEIGAMLFELSTERSNLEEVFLELTNQREEARRPWGG